MCTGQAVPVGSHVRLNLQTGQREVRLGEEQLKYLGDKHRYCTQYVVPNQPNVLSSLTTDGCVCRRVLCDAHRLFIPVCVREVEDNGKAPSFSTQELKNALKKLKEGVEPETTEQEEKAKVCFFDEWS